MLPQTPKQFRKRLLQKIEEAWDKTPELRFGQLIVNIIKTENPCPEVFYFSNEKMMDQTNLWLNERDKKNQIL